MNEKKKSWDGVLWSECLYLPKIHGDTLTPRVTVGGDGTSGR